MDSDWAGGWWGGATRVPSPNFSARPAGARVDTVVLHSISLPPGEYGGDGIRQLFTNTLDWSAHPYYETIRGLEVSAHFVVRRDGAILQFVSIDERAWHAGRSNWQEREAANDWSIGVELEGLEGDMFEPAQYAALEPVPSDLVGYLDEVEREILVRALERQNFNRTAAGASLGLSLRQMRYRMARLGITESEASDPT